MEMIRNKSLIIMDNDDDCAMYLRIIFVKKEKKEKNSPIKLCNERSEIVGIS